MDFTEQAVFVDTNMGTCLGLSVPRDITVREFKREFEREHFRSFSESGEIQVSAVMVQRKALWYRLPDSMSVKSVFRKGEVDWFLHAEARALSDCNRPCLHDCMASKVVDHISERNDISHPSDPVSEGADISHPSDPVSEGDDISYPSDLVYEGGDLSHPSDPESFIMTTKIITKGNCKRWRRKGGKRIRWQQLLPGKLGKLFFFTKKRKRRKNVSLPEKVDQTGIEFITVDDTGVPMHIEEDMTAVDDCASSQEIEPAEEHLASISRRDELTETSSEAVVSVSVSGIINKYFLNLSEDGGDVNRNFLNLSEDGGDVSPTTSVTSRVPSSIPHVTPSASIKFSAKKLLPLPSSSPTDFGGRRYKHDKPEVGERLVMASYSLGISPVNKHPTARLCSLKLMWS